jgi:hypothetical protein
MRMLTRHQAKESPGGIDSRRTVAACIGESTGWQVSQGKENRDEHPDHYIKLYTDWSNSETV